MSAVAQAEPRTTLSADDIGKIEFRTYTPASQRPFLSRAYLADPPVTISGELALPKDTPFRREGKNPAVIIAHGIGGIADDRERAWARRLNTWGIATFVVDSYTGRGIKPPIYADSPRFTNVVAHVLDAYLALQLIATHPRIDGGRVAIMGFSRGGETSLNAVFDPFRAAAIGEAAHRFAAYVAFYPYCNFRHASQSLAAAPMLMMLGAADEMTEPAPCEHLADALKARGVPVNVVVYPNAHHGFDRQQRVVLDRSYVGVRKCEFEYNLDTREVRRLDTGELLATRQAIDSNVRACRRRGAHFGGDPKARESSIAEVRKFLSEVFAK